MLRRRLRFLKEFVVHPATTGAVTSSSRFLVRRMLADAAIRPGETVAEYGPGNGAATRRLLRHLDGFAPDERPRFFAVEVNPEFAAELRRRYPALRVHVGCASNIAEYLRAENRDGVDVVFSGLPWAVFPETLQDAVLDAMVRALRPGGRFVTFAYLQGTVLPAGKRFRRKLEALFPGAVRVSPVVWRNLPPAIVYRGTVPGGDADAPRGPETETP